MPSEYLKLFSRQVSSYRVFGFHKHIHWPTVGTSLNCKGSSEGRIYFFVKMTSRTSESDKKFLKVRKPKIILCPINPRSETSKSQKLAIYSYEFKLNNSYSGFSDFWSFGPKGQSDLVLFLAFRCFLLDSAPSVVNIKEYTRPS